jgi:uncharacterized membrane protein YtjA (UPF0391 family)
MNSEWHGPCRCSAEARLFVTVYVNGLKGNHMLKWTIIFLVVALISGVLGFAGLAGTAAGIAKVLFVIFLALFLATLIQRNA